MNCRHHGLTKHLYLYRYSFQQEEEPLVLNPYLIPHVRVRLTRNYNRKMGECFKHNIDLHNDVDALFDDGGACKEVTKEFKCFAHGYFFYGTENY